MTQAVVTYDPTLDLRHRRTKAARECADWLAWLELEGKSPRTLDSYERTVAILLRTHPQKRLVEISESDLLHMLKRVPAASRRTRRAHLQSFFGWAYRNRRIEHNPLDRVPRVRRPPKRVVPTFTDAEVALLTALPSPDGALFSILFDAGLRKGEARGLQVRHVNLDRSSLVVYRGKGSKDRVVPMTRRLAQALAELFTVEGLNAEDFLWYSRPGGHARSHRHRVGEGTFHRWYDAGLAAAGIEKAKRNPHATRHTMALRWLRRGGRLETLQQVLGHESIRTTMDEYGHLDVTDIERDLALMEAQEALA